jgi:hypothetical protein
MQASRTISSLLSDIAPILVDDLEAIRGECRFYIPLNAFNCFRCPCYAKPAASTATMRSSLVYL